jgi:hypothetical protein
MRGFFRPFENIQIRSLMDATFKKVLKLINSLNKNLLDQNIQKVAYS